CRRNARSAPTTHSAMSTSTSSSRWACKRCSRRPISCSPASIARRRRTSHRQATRDGAARRKRGCPGGSTWTSHTNLIRGCSPAPGAWTTVKGQKLQIVEARKHVFRRFKDVAGKIGEISDVTDASFRVTAQGGTIEVLRVRGADGKRIAAGEFAR